MLKKSFCLSIVTVALLSVVSCVNTAVYPTVTASRNLTRTDVDTLIGQISNWGRWGADDERGTLNLITAQKRLEAIALVREGIPVSLSHNVIKGDVDGSVQALSDALEQLGTSEVQVEIVHRGVGAINESDVLLAQTAGAVIIGFRVRPQTAARQAAEREDVDIHVYDVIYEAVDDVTAALEGMLAPEKRETIEGTAEVRETFKVSKVGTIAGCYVSEGRIDRKNHARLIRDGIVVYDGEISSLKRFKDDVKEVREGFECGIGIANFNDIKVGDLIECYRVEEFARTLASSA